jgi:O-antigen ligase
VPAEVALPAGVACFAIYRQYAQPATPVIAASGGFLIALATPLVTLNGIRVLQIATAADVLLLAGGLLLVAALSLEHITWPSYTLPIAGGVGLLIASVLVSTTMGQSVSGDLRAGVLFLIGSVATPVVVATATRDERPLILIAFLLLVSGAINSGVGLLDGVGLTHIGLEVTGLQFPGRSAGLTVQPNHLGLTCAMVLPVGLTLLTSLQTVPLRLLALTMTLLAAAGVIASGSRGATLGALLGLVVVPLVSHRRRLHATLLGVASLVSLALLYTIGSPLFVSLERLTGRISARGADLARLSTLAETIDDISASPLIGNGYGYVRDAHDIYLQVLAAGGALGLAGWILFVTGFLFVGLRCARDPVLPPRLRSLAGGLVASMVTWLAIGVVENPIYDRYLYWPLGLLLAIYSIRRGVTPTDRSPAPTVPSAVRPSSTTAPGSQ